LVAIHQRTNNLNIQKAQKTKLPKNHQTNKEVGSRTFSREEVQMAKKHMKRCSESLAIRQMYNKTTLRFTSLLLD
jgi:hypothetical protein